MRKSGRKIKQNNCVIPLGVKRPTFESGALAALTAMMLNKFTDSNAANLYVLAEMCSKFESEEYIMRHVIALLKIIDELYQTKYKKSSRWYLPAKSSTLLLIGFINQQSNSQILDHAQAEINRIAA